jgi:two-component system sensor histidine kinase QseC
MIHLALGLESVDGELSRMGVVLGLLWAGATLLAFATILVLRPAVLRPTRDLAAAIARLGPDDLAARVPIERAPQEMRIVVDCLNGLFDRLEQAFKREQATIASIAHELRTPVAELRTALEFRQMTATGEDRTELDALLSTVIHMQTQVSNLLLLARLEAGKEPLQRSDCDLGELVSEAIERWEERAAARGLDLSAGTFARAPITTSPDHLGLVLDNLLGNAVSHATSPGVITLTVSADDRTAQISITNPFAGKLDAEQLGRAYYRGDRARHGGDHTGLGLALCQRLCRVLDAHLELAPTEGHFRATVVFPRKA